MSEQPNVIVIVADDTGSGSISLQEKPDFAA